MVTLDEYDKVQVLLGRPGRPRPKRHAFTYTGLIRCGECGLAITAEHKRNRFGSEYVYYHCTRRRADHRCRQPSVTVEVLEEQILAFLAAATPPAGFHAWGLAKLERASRHRQQTLDVEVQTAEQARQSLDRQLANLTKLRVRDLLSDDEYLHERQILERERIRLSQGEGTLANRVEWFEPAREVVKLSQDLVSRFTTGDARAKGLLLSMVGSNPTLCDRKLLLEARKPFRHWPKNASRTDWLRD